MPALAEDVSSPDGRIVATLDVDGDGVPYYTITRDGNALIGKSQLGFTLTNAETLRRNFVIEDAVTSSFDDTWEQPWGERQFVHDRHNELAVTFRETRDTSKRALTVRMRVFDDGVGFRYEFPENPDQPVTGIAEELTEFVIAPDQDATAWWIQGGDWNRYEFLYKKTPIEEVSTAHTPMTVRLADGTHLAFHEAALVDYSGMWLRRMEDHRFRAQLRRAGARRSSAKAPSPRRGARSVLRTMPPGWSRTIWNSISTNPTSWAMSAGSSPPNMSASGGA